MRGAGVDGVDFRHDGLEAAEDAFGDGERCAKDLFARMRRAEEIVRADGEDDGVRVADRVAHAFGAQACEDVGGLCAVDAEVHRLDGADAASAQLIVETSNYARTGFVSGAVSEGVAEGDDVQGLGMVGSRSGADDALCIGAGAGGAAWQATRSSSARVRFTLRN